MMSALLWGLITTYGFHVMCQHLMFPVSPWHTHCFGHRRERAAIPLITSQSISPSCAFLLISVPLAHPVKYIFFSVVHHDFLSYLLLILLRESIQSVRKSGKLFTNKNNKFIWSCWICDRKKKKCSCLALEYFVALRLLHQWLNSSVYRKILIAHCSD